MPLTAAQRRYRKVHERPESAPVYRCQCGCDEEIPWKPSHWKRRPRFIQIHYLRDGTSSRIKKMREAKLLQRRQPPPDWVAPSGLCECGCGRNTTISKKSRLERGEYIGHPRRWFKGHRGRALLSQRGENHPRWTGGRSYVKGGYIQIYKPDHPSSGTYGYIYEHRYVYEITRNVTLPSSVTVHHINGDKTDNRPENLLATTRSTHVKVHLRAGQVISLFLDDRLMAAAKSHVQAHGELPDLEVLTKELYGDH